MYHSPSQDRPAPTGLEWRPDIERLRGEIKRAHAAGDFEHLAIAEAECWIDLIDAELSARRGIVDSETQQLRRWRWELERMIKTTVTDGKEAMTHA